MEIKRSAASNVDWLEKVTDAQYLDGPPKEQKE
jgi:hypothetical protein